MSTATPNITFTPELRDSLRRAYDEAVAAKRDIFTWNGKQFVTSYAKYMLVYLDDKLGVTA